MPRSSELNGVQAKVRWRRFRDIAIVVLGVLATAAVALLVEDLFPLPSRPGAAMGEPVINGARATVGVVFLGGLVGLLWARQRRSRRSGTLYYVRYLMGFMGDWRIKEVKDYERAHLDLRVVARWCTSPVDQGVIDMSDDIRSMADDLQRTMNDDQVETGFNIAPNLLIPAGVALGYEMYRWEGMIFEELYPGNPPTSISWRLSESNISSDLDVPTVIREVHPESGPNVLVTLSLTGQVDLAKTGWSFGHQYHLGVWDSGQVGRRRPVAVQTSSLRQRDLAALSGTPVKKCLPMPSWLDKFLSWWLFDRAPRRASVRAAELARALKHNGYVHPWVAVVESVKVIRHALHMHPDAFVVVVARVPKTVAMGIGWYLTNVASEGDVGCGHKCKRASCTARYAEELIAYEASLWTSKPSRKPRECRCGCSQASCINPWRRLVFALLDQGGADTRSLLLARSHPSQPSVRELRDAIIGAST